MTKKLVNRKMKNQPLTQCHCRAVFGGTPTTDSRIAVPCPSNRNAHRNQQRPLTSVRCLQGKAEKLTLQKDHNDRPKN